MRISEEGQRAEKAEEDLEETILTKAEELRKRDKELGEAISSQGNDTEEKLENILSDVATNGGGLVDYEDFLGFATKTLSV